MKPLPKPTSDTLNGIDRYLVAQTAVRKMCDTGPEVPTVTLTQAEVSALFETVPELHVFAHTSMS